MSNLIMADERGAVHLSGDLTGATPHSQYCVEVQDGAIILRPTVKYPADWHETSAQQRLQSFLELVRQFPASQVHLTDEKLRRENMYE